MAPAKQGEVVSGSFHLATGVHRPAVGSATLPSGQMEEQRSAGRRARCVAKEGPSVLLFGGASRQCRLLCLKATELKGLDVCVLLASSLMNPTRGWIQRVNQLSIKFREQEQCTLVPSVADTHPQERRLSQVTLTSSDRMEVQP